MTLPVTFEGVEPDGLLPAVFIGWTGQKPGQLIFMAGIHDAYICLDKNGDVMSTMDIDGNYVNPMNNPNFDRRVVYGVMPGEVMLLPAYRDDSMRNAVVSEQFAKIEHLEQIQEWYKAGLTGREIHDLIKAEGGLIADPGPILAQEAAEKEAAKNASAAPTASNVVDLSGTAGGSGSGG